jgi:hypothetical protein
MRLVRRPGELEWWQAGLLAPLVLFLHVMEEAPRFVSWMNVLVEPDITQGTFWRVNAVGMLITVGLAVIAALRRTEASAILTVGWLSLVMLANAMLHITGTLVHGRYSPGTLSAVALYLPFYVWYLTLVVRAHRPGAVEVVAAILLGAAPMLAHGYLIVFRGSRLM